MSSRSGVTLQSPRTTVTVPELSARWVPESLLCGMEQDRWEQSWMQLVQGPGDIQVRPPVLPLVFRESVHRFPLLELWAQLGGEHGPWGHPQTRKVTTNLPQFSHLKIGDNQASLGKWLLPLLAWAGRAWTQQGDGGRIACRRQTRSQPKGHLTCPLTCPDTGSALRGKGQARKTTFLSSSPTLSYLFPIVALQAARLSSPTSQVRKLRL